MKLKHILLFGILIVFGHEGYCQLDTKHWIPPFYAKPGANSGQTNLKKHFVSLSTPSVDTIPVTIKNGYGEIIDVVNISRNMSQEYVFSPIGNATTDTYPLNVIPTDSLNMPIRSQGLYFESYQPFFVNMRHKSGSQGTSLTSKGQIALGTRFYSGHLFTLYNVGSQAETWNNERRSHFVSVMATEDSTTVTFDMIKEPISYIGQTPGEPITVTLDAFESYVIGIDHSLYNDSTINNSNGTRITSDKPIACNTGSWLSGNMYGQCIGSDQIVPADITGQEYILVRGLGDESTEHPMVVATEDNTQVYVNDETTPAIVLDEGEYYIVPTDKFTANDNMYIATTKKVYMYQTLSGSAENIGPTVGLSFIPPLNCVGAKRVVLPFVNSLAGGNGQGRINIITKSGTSIYINESTTPLTGAQQVTGISDWVSYAFDPPSDNVIIESDSVMNVALLTRDANVGTAGYFSGFTLEPVVGLSAGYPGTDPCVPGNAVLQVYGFDTYQWYFNGEPIEGATGSTLLPEYSGSYTVEGIDLACGFRFLSNEFTIPFCPSTLGVAKQVQVVQETAPGSRIFDVTYRMFIENLAPGASQNIQVIENIEGGLPVGAAAELIDGPTLVFGIMSGGVNPDFDGINDKRLFPGNGSLPGLAADAVELTVRVDMNAAEQDGYFNQVTVTSKDDGVNDGVNGPFSGQDYSDDGTNPDPDGNGDPNEDGENDPTLTCFFTNEINYGEQEFCITDTLQEVTQDGVSSGMFTADAPGLVVDSLTGAIHPSAGDAGTYTVTFTVEGRCPTVTTTEVTITDLLSAGTAIDDTDVCIDADAIELSDYIEGEDEGGVWTNEEGVEIEEFDPESAGNYTFTYTLENGACGTQSSTVNIIVVPEPEAGTPIDDLEICETAESVDLSQFLEDEDEGGIWTDADGNTISATFTPEGSGTASFTYTVDNSVCEPASVSFSLEILAAPDAGEALEEALYCVGETVNLNGLLIDADLDGDWTDDEGDSVEDEITIGAAGDYTYVYVVDHGICGSDSTAVSFSVVEGLSTGHFEGSVTACPEDEVLSLFNLLQGADPGGEWTDGDDNAMSNGLFDPEDEGTFTFTYTLIDEQCGEISTEIVINVEAEDCLSEELLIPEGFSPNGDGIGDYWVVKGLYEYPSNSVLVFNRWGNEVFSAAPYNNDWNGRAERGVNSGEVLPVGTYWYILDLGDGSDPRKGFIYLNR